ncbi:MAG: phosphopantetheine-binding protein, partial [Actinobacteria bacterium]|nr:phosphopantetheine-binding protein [Actinomycetota bacterium]
MSCRFPGARNLDEYYSNLRNGKCSICFFTRDEMLKDGVPAELLNNPDYVNAGGFIADFDKFDAAFWNYNPRMAKIMNPEHRLMLEEVWKVFENAGYNILNYKNDVGVFLGSSISSTAQFQYHILSQNNKETLDLSLITDKDFLANRIAYEMNLRGPALNIQTACSTGLVVIHQACQSLLNGECSMAVAGGVAIKHKQKSGYLYQEGGVNSSDGYCRSFDKSGNGSIFTNGIGVVVLKCLEDAVHDSDRVLAVIRSSCINNDGRQKIGFHAPSETGQERAILNCIRMADIDSNDIGYVECHGTATQLGDSIEINALKNSFKKCAKEIKHNQYCAIGSVKTNIGHTEAAAGVAGFIKTVLSLSKKEIYPSLYYNHPNPEIDFENSPFYVNTKLQEWKIEKEKRRIASVNSYAIGGTNAHIILEEWTEFNPVKNNCKRQYRALPLSAKSLSSLNSATSNFLNYLQNNPKVNIDDVAHTLQLGRASFPYKSLVICRDVTDAIDALNNRDKSKYFTNNHETKLRNIVLMFSGQSAIYINMGRELYEHENVFRAAIDSCAGILKRLAGYDLLEILYPKANEITVAEKKITNPCFEKMVLFVIQYAVANLWQSLRVKSSSMIGYGVGELIVASLAGVVSLEDALTLLAKPDSFKAISQIIFNKPQIPIFSTLTGNWLTDTEATSYDHWDACLRNQINLGNFPVALLKDKESIFIESGSRGLLCNLLSQRASQSLENSTIISLPRAIDNVSSLEHFYTAFGKLWLYGYDIDFNTLYKDEKHNKLSLPTYSFEHKRCWINNTNNKSILRQIEKEKIFNKKEVTSRINNQQKLSEIWREILGYDEINIRDNFFEIGGTSLIAADLRKSINDVFGTKISVVDIFTYPTIEKLASHIFGDEEKSFGMQKRPVYTMDDNIAIIAYSGMFPGSSNSNEYWENILSGKDCLVRLSRDDGRSLGVSEAHLKSENYILSGAIFPNIDKFDAGFWGLSPKNAELMDPQTRLFLEHAWMALESSGYINYRDKLNIGVFAGS